MIKLSLTNTNKHILIDDEDYDKVTLYNWYWNSTAKSIHTTMRSHSLPVKGDVVYLASFILDYYGPLEVDHKDRNIFNNQKFNLRKATHQQNCINRKNYGNTSGFRGVTWDKRAGRWVAGIKVEGSRIYLGRFDIKEDAAKAYNKAATRYFGEFAILNIFGDTQ